MQIPRKMLALQLLGHGGFEQLKLNKNVLVPRPKGNEVLIKVASAGPLELITLTLTLGLVGIPKPYPKPLMLAVNKGLET